MAELKCFDKCGTALKSETQSDFENFKMDYMKKLKELVSYLRTIYTKKSCRKRNKQSGLTDLNNESKLSR